MKARELIGYLMGLILYVILVPLIMWKLSGEVHPNAVLAKFVQATKCQVFTR
jgi:hypothetical protein